MPRSEERARVAVDIIVPIYNARDKLALCVDSVLRHARGEYRLILVNDASPDPEMRPYLDGLAAAHSDVVAIHAEVNGGFVKSVNRGMAVAGGRDVLMLNSDTVVTPEFLERLQDCVHADGTTGIVTPFSNNATICSLPKFCEDNSAPALDELDDYGACISKHSMRKRPEIVTGVGFAMYVRASVVERIGILDEAFGRGFGEENDYCERAKAAGYKVRLCDDVFIAHTGKASFGVEGFEFEQQNAAILRERWPAYFRDVADFCRLDPVREVRENALYHLRRRKHVDAGAVLQVVHFNPFRAEAGGTEFYVLDVVKGLAAARALIAYRTPDAVMVAEILDGDLSAPLLHRFPVQSAWHHHVLQDEQLSEVFARVLDEFGVRVAHLHHLFGWPLDLWKALEERGIPYLYTVHDYYCVCTNQNMLDFERMEPCSCQPGSGQAERCQAAYAKTQRTDRDQLWKLAEHRAVFGPLLTHARSILPPSEKAADVVRRAYADLDLAIRVLPHGREEEQDVSLDRLPADPARLQRAPHLRVGFLGCINHPSKGAAGYLHIVSALAAKPYEWHFFGDMQEFQFQRKVEALGLKGRTVFHGFYRREEIVRQLRDSEVDVVVLAPPWDETFSYTLSEALCAGVPVLALRRGALTERVEAAGLGECLFDSWEELAQALQETPPCLEEWKQKARAYRHRSIPSVVEELRGLYGPAAEERVALSLPQQAATFAAYWAQECKVRPWEWAEAQRPSAVIDLERRYPAFWFSTYRTLRPVLPKKAREAVRNRILTKLSEWMQHYPAAELAKSWYPAADLECVTHGSAVRIETENGDPYIVLPEFVTQGGRLDFLRVRLRTERPTPANLQCYWINPNNEGFSEERSISVTMAHTAEWQEYVLDLRRAWAWDALPGEGGIKHLRLDPLDHSGTVWIDSLTVGRWKPEALELR